MLKSLFYLALAIQGVTSKQSSTGSERSSGRGLSCPPTPQPVEIEVIGPIRRQSHGTVNVSSKLTEDCDLDGINGAVIKWLQQLRAAVGSRWPAVYHRRRLLRQ